MICRVLLSTRPQTISRSQHKSQTNVACLKLHKRLLNMTAASTKRQKFGANGATEAAPAATAIGTLRSEASFALPGPLQAKDHYVAVPLVHGAPDRKDTLEIFVREVTASGSPAAAKRPALLYLQGTIPLQLPTLAHTLVLPVHTFHGRIRQSVKPAAAAWGFPLHGSRCRCTTRPIKSVGMSQVHTHKSCVLTGHRWTRSRGSPTHGGEHMDQGRGGALQGAQVPANFSSACFCLNDEFHAWAGPWVFGSDTVCDLSFRRV